MRKYAPVALLLTILAVVGWKLFPSLSPETSPKPGNRERPVAGEVPREEQAAAQPAGAAGDPRSPLMEEEAFECALPPQCQKQEYLIVTLPDPLASSSGYRFDTLVDALQRAAEKQSYVLDSYYYPWKSAAKLPEPGRPTRLAALANLLEIDLKVASSTPASKQSRSTFPLYQGKPGILAFRRTQQMDGRPDRLVMFLVGETATRGIDRTAFCASLKWMKQHGGFEPGRPIPVLGPFFSGAQASLGEAIAQFESCPSFRIISGSATNIKLSELQRSMRGHCFTFQTTVHSEIVLKWELMSYLKVRQKGERVVVLEESNTQLGNLHPPPAASDAQTQHGPSKEEEGQPAIHLPFPLHISQVRSAYSRAQAASGSPLPQVPIFSGKLHIPSEEGPEPMDTEPGLTPNTTAAITEQVLSHILSTIARERTKYVVILATDLKDKIFLTTQIRTYCPDVQLVITGSDLAMNHPDHRYYFKGALVVSTYPIYSKNQEWSYPFNGQSWRLLLPDEQSQGVYNAAVALLGRDSQDLHYLVGYGPPFSKDATCSYRPPVWISIIGQDDPHPLHGAMPIKEHCPEEERNAWEECESYVYPAPAEPGHPKFKPQYTGSWAGFCIGVILFCSWAAWSSLMAFRRAIGVPGWSWTWDWDRDIKKLRQVIQSLQCQIIQWLQYFVWQRMVLSEDNLVLKPRRHLILCYGALSVLVFYIFVITAIPVAVHHFSGDMKDVVIPQFYHYLLLIVLSVLILPLLLITLLMTFGCMIRTIRLPGYNSTKPFLKYASFLVFVLVYLIDVRCFLPTASDALLFMDRATDLAGGVTPILPIFFLAMAFLCLGYHQLEKCRLFAEARQDNPFPAGSYPLKKIEETNGNLESFFKSPHEVVFLPPMLTAVVVLVLLFLFSRIYGKYVPSVEGSFHDCLLLLGFAGFTLLLALVFLQTLWLWDRLHDLLRTIAKLPLAKAFDRLPRAIVDTFGPYLSTPSHGKESQHELRLQQLRALALQYGSVRDRLKTTFHPTAPDLQSLDQAMWYASKKTPENVARAARKKWQSAGSRGGRTLHFWLEAEAEEARQRVNANMSRPLSQKAFTSKARACLKVLHACWQHLEAREGHCDPPPAESAGKSTEELISPYLARPGDLDAPLDANSIKALQAWLQMAEDFVAIEVTTYLSQFFVHLRKLGRSLTWAALLWILAIVSYPFHPQRLMLTIAAALVLILVGYALYIVLQIEWDEVVSRIRKSTPQQLNLSWSLVSHIALYIVPVLGVVGAASSTLSDLLHSLLDPIYQVLK